VAWHREDGRPIVPAGMSMGGMIAFQVAALPGPRVVPGALAPSPLDVLELPEGGHLPIEPAAFARLGEVASETVRRIGRGARV
jgi:alpha-beta hydrolase superfamily lysophospholipase